MTVVEAPPERGIRRIDAPYKGLSYFTEDDSEIFFGRTNERLLIATTLLTSRFTVVYGESGVGKSSLLRAGAVHDLRERAVRERIERSSNGAHARGAAFIPVVCSNWVGDPIQACDTSIRGAANGLVDELPAEIAATKFDELLELWCDATLATLLIVLDQFEEYLLYHQPAADDVLGEGLARAVRRRELNVRFIVSIREDALAKLDRYEERIPRLLDNLIRVEHLNRQAGVEAIRGPIGRYNAALGPGESRIEIEDALVTEVLAQVARDELGTGDRASRTPGDAGIETAFLQLVMERLWKEQRESGSTVIRLATLEALGGSKRIVFAHLEDALDALTDDEKAIAAKAFGLLVTRSRQKYAQSPSDIAAELDEGDPIVVASVLERLSKKRILRQVPPAAGSSDVRYEIFHDKLADPIIEWRVHFEEQARRNRDRRRLFLYGTVAAIAVAIAAALAVLSFVVVQQNDAARNSRSRELAAKANQLLATDPAAGLVLAARALGLADTTEAEAAFRAAADTTQSEVLQRPGSIWTAVTVSADGRRILTFGNSASGGSAVVWDAATAKPLAVLNTASIESATLDRAGTHILTLGGGHVRLWRVGPRGAVELGAGFGNDIVHAALSPDGRHVVTAATNGKTTVSDVTVWDAWNGTVLASLQNRSVVTSLDLSPDGALVLQGDGRGATIWRWRSRVARPILLKDARVPVTSVAFSSDGRLFLIVAAGSAQLRALDQLRSAPLLRVPDVLSAGFDRDGSRLLTVGGNGAVRVWDAATRKQIATLRGHNTGAAFSPNGKLVATADTEGAARVWDIRSATPFETLAAGGRIVSVAFSSDGERVVTESADGTARIWDLHVATQFVARRLTNTTADPNIALSPDGKRMVAIGSDYTARLVDLANGTSVRLGNGELHLASRPSFSADGTRFVAVTIDGAGRQAVGVWDARTGRALSVPLGGGEQVYSAVLSADGRVVATADANGEVRVTTIADGRFVRFRDHPGARVLATTGSGSGRRSVVTADTSSRTARLWSLQGHSWKPLVTLTGQADSAASSDGAFVVTADGDPTARIWRWAHPDAEPTVLQPTRTAAFSSDGKFVLAGSPDGSVRLWASSGEQIGLFRGSPGDQVIDAALSHDGTHVSTVSVSRNDDVLARVYACAGCVPTDTLRARAAAIAARDK